MEEEVSISMIAFELEDSIVKCPGCIVNLGVGEYVSRRRVCFFWFGEYFSRR